MYELKLSVILGNVGSCSDRYCTGGYSRSYTIEELFDRVDPSMAYQVLKWSQIGI